MTRRRIPRPGSSPSPRAARGADSGRGSGKARVAGEVDWTGVVRVVVLVGVAGGVAAFLFYPDITRLVERWHNASRPSPDNQADRHVHPEPDLNKARADEEPGRGGKAAVGGDGGSGKQAASSARSDSRQPAKDPGSPGTTSDNVRGDQRTDLMEAEEEEDLVELELLGEEEAPIFVDIGEEEDEPDDDEETDGDRETVQLRHQRSTGDREKPVVLTDGQTITFTPVSQGDENFIRFGGRPKDKKDKPSTTSKAKPVSPNASKSNASKSDKSAQAKKSSDTKEPDSKSTKSSNQKTISKSSPAGKQDSPSGSNDLPEEVQNFKPAYLRTVTAKKIFADGRRIPPVELLPEQETNSSVRVFLFNEFLSEAECDGLRRVHDKHVQDLTSLPPLLCFDSLTTLRKHLAEVKRDIHVTPNDFMKGTRCVNASFSHTLSQWMAGNWSYSTAFYPGESRFSAIFEARVHQAMGLDPKNGGKFQITSYPTGKAYKAHTDCVLGGTDQRDRVATVLVYLDDVSDGGETKFPELGIWVKPRKGRALVWNNMSPDGVCEPHSLHVASRVNQGSKYILIRWYYYKSFYSLGKRPPEPPLPSRTTGTPRVSCDDYDNGSCRWYDEWNNDHLLDYEMQKYTLI